MVSGEVVEEDTKCSFARFCSEEAVASEYVIWGFVEGVASKAAAVDGVVENAEEFLRWGLVIDEFGYL